MKVLYHVGATIGADTIVKKGRICEDFRPLMIETEDKNIVFDAIKSVQFVKLNGLGTMIKLQNNSNIIYLAVPRIYIDKGTGFAIINFSATRKLKYLLDSELVKKNDKHLAMDLVVEYVEAIQKIEEIEESGLDSNSKVGKNNKLADRIRKIAIEIEKEHPDTKYAFYQLIFHEKSAVRKTRGRFFCLKRAAALSVSSGNKMWLTNWFQEHPEDKHLL